LPGLQPGCRAVDHRAALSGGRLQVKVFPAGQLVGAMESFDAVSSGLAEFYHTSEVTWTGKSTTFAYFCNVPFGFTADEINAWVYYGGGQALSDELSAGFGLKIAIAVPIKFELAINLSKVRKRSAWAYRRGLSRVPRHLKATGGGLRKRTRVLDRSGTLFSRCCRGCPTVSC
jgi:hypothetical protein